MPCGTEAIVLLKLIEVICNKRKHIESGSIKIFIDNSYNNRSLKAEILKLNMCTQKAGAEIAKMK